MSDSPFLTIGQLAKRVGLRTSALRYYEKIGLLTAHSRTEAGYRLYHKTAENSLRLIQRAQQLGLSLDDIRHLLQGYQAGHLPDETVIQTVEARAIALEQQITELLVQRHELHHFLQDVRHESGPVEHLPEQGGIEHLDKLIERICAHPHAQTPRNILDWLLDSMNCQLNSQAGQQLLQRLEGQHVHVWQDDKDSYHILLATGEVAVQTAVSQLADLEATCQPQNAPTTYQDAEGIHFIATGDHAFIFARLFLSLAAE